jgi:hypothetical protein
VNIIVSKVYPLPTYVLSHKTFFIKLVDFEEGTNVITISSNVRCRRHCCCRSTNQMCVRFTVQDLLCLVIRQSLRVKQTPHFNAAPKNAAVSYYFYLRF